MHGLYLTSSLLLTLVLISGCGGGYKIRPPKHPLPNPQHAASMNSDEDVRFDFKMYDKNDSLAYLGEDFIKAGYYPVQITLLNNTRRRLEICDSSAISLTTSHLDEVARSLFKPGSFYYRVWSEGIGMGMYSNSSVLSVESLPFFLEILHPSIIDKIYIDSDHGKSLKEYREKHVNNISTVDSGSLWGGIVFIPHKDFDHMLSVTLFDPERGKHITCTGIIGSLRPSNPDPIS